ncbi:polysaccharide deacetylase family protein [Natronoglomus mannanivorans]|uniref:Polysaccharide deacetylase family protein n=1 Tax=Natronoglomus mannanivorans TaxID=2979990 RepID=A0AAP2Z0M0_9EURY|nr:polysaccharide deacetylase family protein [Halobacteria archaeon AArc-xg1-1]
MKRRAYLAMAASVGLAGCTAALETNEPDVDTTSENQTAEVQSTGRSTSEESGEPESSDEPEEPDDPADTDHPEIAGTFDDFEDLSRWTALEGSLSPADDAFLGAQSALLESDEASNRVTISREFDSPLDLSEVVPGLAVTAEEMVTPTIRLFDAAGNRIDYRRAITGGLPFVRYNFGVRDVDGDPDLSAITELQVIQWTGEETVRFRCDDLHFVPRPETGKVMIQFDDGFETDYTEGFPILEQYEYPAVTFVNPSRIGNDNRLDVKQAEALSDAGWAIGNHCNTHPHLSELKPAKQDAEIREGKEWLVDHGFEDGARYFAYPFGDFDATTIDLVAKHHDLGFAGGLPAQGYATNPQLCSRIGDPDAERACRALDLAAEMRGITTLFYHELEGQLLEDFETTIDHLHDLESAGELEVILPSDLEERFLF